jgi:acetyltransferase-like isoleucine patch superfamily enzyme
MSAVYKLVQFLIKASLRLPLYLRGLGLYLKIHACGGTCASVPRVDKGFVLRYPPHSGVRLGRGLRIGPNSVIECPPGALLEIGDRVGLTAGVFISAQCEVVVGNDCLFAEWVSIRDAEHGTGRTTTIASQELRYGAVRIEDDVWLGKGSTVLLGSVIRRGCVLGSNSFFKNKTSEPYGIYVGAPSRLLKMRGAA